MHNLYLYMSNLRDVLGSRYDVAIAIFYLLIECFLVLSNRKQKMDRALVYVGGVLLCLLLPVAYIGSIVLHMEGSQQKLLFYLAPGIILGAMALTHWWEAGTKRFGRKAIVPLCLLVIFLAGQPWMYQTKDVKADFRMDRAKVPEEITALGQAMGEGTVALPKTVGQQLGKVQQVTRMEYRDTTWFEDDTDIGDIVYYLVDKRATYVVLPKQGYNASYMEIVRYNLAYETEHYEIYIDSEI